MTDPLHQAGVQIDVWTLDAGHQAIVLVGIEKVRHFDWQSRLEHALRAGVDVVTTNTTHALAASSAFERGLQAAAAPAEQS